MKIALENMHIESYECILLYRIKCRIIEKIWLNQQAMTLVFIFVWDTALWRSKHYKWCANEVHVEMKEVAPNSCYRVL